MTFEHAPSQAPTLNDSPVFVSSSEFKDVFRKINGDGRDRHDGSPLKLVNQARRKESASHNVTKMGNAKAGTVPFLSFVRRFKSQVQITGFNPVDGLHPFIANGSGTSRLTIPKEIGDLPTENVHRQSPLNASCGTKDATVGSTDSEQNEVQPRLTGLTKMPPF